MTTEFPLETLLRFWAKTTHDKERYPNAYHPLICHMIDVAVVTLVMWEEVLPKAAKKRIAQALGLPTDQGGLELAGRIVAWIAGLHDLGKASPPFAWRADSKETQRLLQLFTLPPFQYLRNQPPQANQAPHGYVTAVTLPPLLCEYQVDKTLANQIGEIIGGHHGIFASNEDLNKLRKSLKKNGIYVGNSDWQKARQDMAKYLAELLDLNLGCLKSLPSQRFDNATVMLIAGLVSVADWIGSNTSYFHLKVKNACPFGEAA